jgi:type II secretory pathway component GspD/PulD (secretin)
MALNDTIVVYDFPEKIAEAEKVIKTLDVKPKQVLIEATILSALLDEDSDFGIDWNLLNGERLTGSLTQIANTTTGTPIETLGMAIPGAAFQAGFTSGDLVGLITATESVTDVTVLANPKILAVNKQQGSLLIGKKLGYNSQTTQTDGGTTTSKVEFYESGTRLVFRPYIGNDGYIRMEIYPKDSSAELNATTGAPDETTTELQANIIVKDGETIVIGGIYTRDKSTNTSGVPGFKDIPVLGWLFKTQGKTDNKTELLIFLTPSIVQGDADT